jgi:hypothetical protein
VRLLDAELAAPRRLIIVGGAAVALHVGSSTGTKDVDTWGSNVDDLVASCRARGIALPPFEAANVGDVPWDYDERLEHVLPELSRLEVMILEAHDLVLMKTMRWHDGDEADVRELHAAKPLAWRTLVARYREEMTHVLGHRSRLDWNLIQCVEVLFGELAAEEAKVLIRGTRR